MKSILIDVIKQEVKEVEHDNTLSNIYKHVDCGTFDVVRIDAINSIYIDDEGFFVTEKVCQIWKEHIDGSKNWSSQLWNILMFQSWLENQRR